MKREIADYLKSFIHLIMLLFSLKNPIIIITFKNPIT